MDISQRKISISEGILRGNIERVRKENMILRQQQADMELGLQQRKPDLIRNSHNKQCSSNKNDGEQQTSKYIQMEKDDVILRHQISTPNIAKSHPALIETRIFYPIEARQQKEQFPSMGSYKLQTILADLRSALNEKTELVLKLEKKLQSQQQMIESSKYLRFQNEQMELVNKEGAKARQQLRSEINKLRTAYTELLKRVSPADTQTYTNPKNT